MREFEKVDSETCKLAQGTENCRSRAESIECIDFHFETFRDTGHIAANVAIGVDTQFLSFDLTARKLFLLLLGKLLNLFVLTLRLLMVWMVMLSIGLMQWVSACQDS